MSGSCGWKKVLFLLLLVLVVVFSCGASCDVDIDGDGKAEVCPAGQNPVYCKDHVSVCCE